MKNVVYGIPTCGTVKKARKWLDGNGIEYQWVDTREKPPSKARLTRWLKAFGFKPMRNTSGGAYRALPPEKKEWGDREWLPAFEKDVMLLKRPVLEQGGKPVAVGFKADAWKEIF